MKRIAIISISFFLSITLYSQVIRIDSIKVYHQNFILDSIQMSISSKVHNLDTITYNDNNLHGCGLVFFGPVFKGCTTNNFLSIDTTFIFPSQTVWSRLMIFYAVWDTVSLCPFPSTTTYTDTLIWDKCFATNIEENISYKRLIVYPNPVNDRLFIQSSESIQSVMIYSISGHLMLQTKTSISEIDVASLKQGVYFMQVQFESGISQSQKILIQR